MQAATDTTKHATIAMAMKGSFHVACAIRASIQSDRTRTPIGINCRALKRMPRHFNRRATTEYVPLAAR